jgi:hypothetical protein
MLVPPLFARKQQTLGAKDEEKSAMWITLSLSRAAVDFSAF